MTPKKRGCCKTLDEQGEGEKGVFPGIPAAAPFFFPGGTSYATMYRKTYLQPLTSARERLPTAFLRRSCFPVMLQ